MCLNGYKDESGVWVLPNGDVCEYEEAALISMLGLCVCGTPNSAIRYIRDALQLVHDFAEGGVTYEDWRQSVKSLFGSQGAEYFMWYWLDEKGFTDHGGAVPGWLTDWGKGMLAYLNEYISKTQ